VPKDLQQMQYKYPSKVFQAELGFIEEYQPDGASNSAQLG